MRFLRVVIMASGFSKRFKSNKLFVKINGLYMYQHSLRNVAAYFKKNPSDGIGILVSQYPEILKEAQSLGLVAIYNSSPERGISTSIKLGIAYPLKGVPNSGEVAVFVTADQPWFKRKTLFDFLQTARQSDSGILCTAAECSSGNPVGFDKKYYTELLALEGDRGGKIVMHKHLEDTSYFQVKSDELKDVDVPEDL